MIGSFPFGSTGLGGLANTSAASAQWSQSGKASIKKAATQSQSGISKIQAHATRTQSGIAKIRKSTTKTQSGVANIHISKTITGRATIRVPHATKTQTGVSYIKSLRSSRIILIMTQFDKPVRRNKEYR